MFKLISIGVLLYVLYKLVFPNQGLNSPKSEQIKNGGDDETIDIDYEEVD